MRSASAISASSACGSHLSFTDTGIEFLRGLAFIESEGTTRLRVSSLDAVLELKPGRHLLAADGRGQLFATVLEGVARVSVAGGTWLAGQTGQTLAVAQTPLVWKETRFATNCSAACRIRGVHALVKGRTEPGSQVFVNGNLSYPDADGRFELSLPEGKDATQGVLLVRGPTGGICRAEFSCRER